MEGMEGIIQGAGCGGDHTGCRVWRGSHRVEGQCMEGVTQGGGGGGG